MNLKEWVASQGVSYAVARKWYRAGMLPVPARKVGGLVLIGDRAVSTIVVEHRDRFARFGAEYVQAALAASGRRLLVSALAEDPS